MPVCDLASKADIFLQALRTRGRETYHGGLGSYAASGGSGLGDHAVGTLQQFGQFAVPLLKSLDPQP
jgi:hypothetical protein